MIENDKDKNSMERNIKEKNNSEENSREESNREENNMEENNREENNREENNMEENNMGMNWLELISGQSQIKRILEANTYSSKYGLTLTEEDAKLLVAEKKNTLKEQKRVEFRGGIIPDLIYEFGDSAYISQDQYVETLMQLQNIFYMYKNEMCDEITDTELLHFMREQFDDVCFGDLEYLSGTCLAVFADAIRAGYRDYVVSDGCGSFQEIDLVTRWDYDLFLKALENEF